MTPPAETPAAPSSSAAPSSKKTPPEEASPWTEPEEAPNPYTSFPPEEEGEPELRVQFGLAALLVVVTLSALWLAVTVMAPGLGILSAMLLVPALVRSVAQTARARRTGYQPVLADRFAFFLTSLGVVLLAMLAAIAAFFPICLTGLVVSDANQTFGETSIIVVLAASTLAAAGACGWVYWFFWPRAPRNK